MKPVIYALIIALFIVLFIISISYQEVEKFISYRRPYYRRPYYRRPYYNNFRYPIYNRYCSSCESKSSYGCKSCLNCGLCYDNYGNIDCVSGSKFGPYFRKDCAAWKYQ